MPDAYHRPAARPLTATVRTVLRPAAGAERASVWFPQSAVCWQPKRLDLLGGRTAMVRKRARQIERRLDVEIEPSDTATADGVTRAAGAGISHPLQKPQRVHGISAGKTLEPRRQGFIGAQPGNEVQASPLAIRRPQQDFVAHASLISGTGVGIVSLAGFNSGPPRLGSPITTKRLTRAHWRSSSSDLLRNRDSAIRVTYFPRRGPSAAPPLPRDNNAPGTSR